ncbi:MAG: FIST C-terminal domain-containing protein [Candidatus Pacebacteria bacterium]|nr:FIST C-terminal domain-containing protein [Candidatus Paceibacterota bacterium]
MINKKIIIGAVTALVVIIGAFLLFFLRDNEDPVVEEEPEVVIEEREVKLKIGTGYGVLSENTASEEKEEVVVLEAFNKMMEELGEDPSFVVLTSTVGFDQEKIIQEARKVLPEGVKIYGYTSLFGIMTKDGFKIGEGVEEGNVLSMMGFSGENLVVGVGGAELSEGDSPEQTAKIATERAIKDAGKEDSPKIAMMASAHFGAGEDLFIKGAESVLGEQVPIVGGGAAAGYGDLVSGGESLFVNDKAYEKGVVVAVIYTDTKIGHAFLGGFNPAGPKGEVTEVARDEKGIRIITIDDQPAAEVYNEWLGGELDEFMGTSNMFLHKTLYHTLGIEVLESDGTKNWHMIITLHFNEDDSINIGTVIPEGTEIHLLESDPELFIERLGLAVRLARARGGVPQEEIAGVLVDQCGASLLGIPEKEGWDQMIEKTMEASGGAPFIGNSNLGPYGNFFGVGNRYGEVTPSVLIFSKY